MRHQSTIDKPIKHRGGRFISAILAALLCLTLVPARSGAKAAGAAPTQEAATEQAAEVAAAQASVAVLPATEQPAAGQEIEAAESPAETAASGRAQLKAPAEDKESISNLPAPETEVGEPASGGQANVGQIDKRGAIRDKAVGSTGSLAPTALAQPGELPVNPLGLGRAAGGPAGPVGAAPETQAETPLADGQYTVPVALMHAYEAGKTSMGNPAVIPLAVAQVQNGKADLYVQMTGLSFMGLYGHLWDMFQYTDPQLGDSFQGPTAQAAIAATGEDTDLEGKLRTFPEIMHLSNCDVTKGYVPVRVHVDAMDALQSPGGGYDNIRKGVGAQNAKLVPVWSEAKVHSEGESFFYAMVAAAADKYIQEADQIIAAEQAKRQSQSVADVDRSELLNALVAARDQLQGLRRQNSGDATALFNAIQTLKYRRHEFQKGSLGEVDKSALKEVLDKVKAAAYKEADYTAKSWQVYAAALSRAEAVYAADRPAKPEVQSAVKDLQAASEGLLKKADKSTLNQLLMLTKFMKPQGFPPADWQNLQDARAAAQSVSDNVDADQSAVTAAASKLNQAARKLVDPAARTLLQKCQALQASDYEADYWTETFQPALLKLEQEINNPDTLYNRISMTKNKLQTAFDGLKPVAKTLADGHYLVPVEVRDTTYSATWRADSKPLVDRAALTVKAGKAEVYLFFQNYDQHGKISHLTNLDFADVKVKERIQASERNFEDKVLNFDHVIVLEQVDAANTDIPVSYQIDSKREKRSGSFIRLNYSQAEKVESTELGQAVVLRRACTNYLKAEEIAAAELPNYKDETVTVYRQSMTALAAALAKQEATAAELFAALEAAKQGRAQLELKPQERPDRLADGIYQLPISLRNAHEDKLSMGHPALVHQAIAVVKDNRAELYVQMKGMRFMGMYGHLWGMFQYVDETEGVGDAFKGETVEADVLRSGQDSDLEKKMRAFPEVLRLNNCDVTKSYVPIKVYVDAMDALTNNASTYDKVVRGAGSQNAKLTPDWARAIKLPDGTKAEAAILLAGAKDYLSEAQSEPGQAVPERFKAYQVSKKALEEAVRNAANDADRLFTALQDFKLKKHELDKPIESKTEPTPTTKPTEQTPTTKPTEPTSTTRPTEPTSTTKPTEPTPTTKPIEPTQPAKVKYYEVPVRLRHAYEDKFSMGDPALVKTAKVYPLATGMQYEVSFTGMQFMGLYGHLWDLFYLNPPCKDDQWTHAEVSRHFTDTDLEGKQRQFPQTYRLTLTAPEQQGYPEQAKKTRVKVLVNVDAMDALTNGASTYDKVVKGSGKQQAYLEFDWSQAKTVRENGQVVQPTNPQKPSQPTAPQPTARPTGRPNLPSATLPQPPANPQQTGERSDHQQVGGSSHQAQSGLKTRVYNVPVQLMHAYENRPSMGNPALVKTARVYERSDGTTQIVLTINGMRFMGMYGHVWNLFHYSSSGLTPAGVIGWSNDSNLIGEKQQFPNTFSLIRSGKEDRIKVRVWVDAMDAIASNNARSYAEITPGAGAQEAYLTLDWGNATLLEERDGSAISSAGSAADPASLKQEAVAQEKANPDNELSKLGKKEADEKDKKKKQGNKRTAAAKKALGTDESAVNLAEAEPVEARRSGINSTWLYAGGALIVIIAAGGVAYFVLRKKSIE